MPSTYTVNLGIEKPATGEQSGTWGDTTNLNFDMLDQAINGAVSITLASAGTSGSPNTLAISDGAVSDGRNKWIEFTDGADLGATAYVQLTPNDAEKIVLVRNSLSGSRSVILFQGTYDAGRDLEVPAGVDMLVKFSGGGATATTTNVFQRLRVEELNIAGTTTVDGVIDDDTMATASATKLATSESIKTYVDNTAAAQNELSEVLANGNTTGGTDIAVSTGDDITFADSSKAIFGAGSDFQIYHDGSNSYIVDSGVGGMYLQGNGLIQLQEYGGTEVYAQFLRNAEVNLFYDNTKRFETTNTGILVTGTSAANKLSSVDGTDIDMDVNAAGQIEIDGSGYAGAIALNSDGLQIYHNSSSRSIILGTNETARLEVTGIGDVRFKDSVGANSFIYDESIGITINEQGADRDLRVESSGATYMFFVDGGNNRVGINTSTPAKTLDVNGTVAISDDFAVDTDTLFVDVSAKRVGINTDNPVAPFAVYAETGEAELAARFAHPDDGSDVSIRFQAKDASSVLQYADIRWDPDDKALIFETNYPYATTDNRLQLDETGAVFNEGSGDDDFRVESNNYTHMFYVDGTNDAIGINTSAPTANVGLTITGQSDNPSMSLFGDNPGATQGNRASIRFNADYTQAWEIGVGDNMAGGGRNFTIQETSTGSSTTATAPAYMFKGNGDGRFYFTDSNDNITTDLNAEAGFAYVFNEQGSDIDFRVESLTNENMFVVNAGAETVNVGAAGNALFNVVGDTNGYTAEIKTGTNYEGWRLVGSQGLGNGQMEVTPVTTPGSGTANLWTIFANGGTVGSGGATRHNVVVDGNLIVNPDGESAADFRAESANYSNMLLVDSGNDCVIMGDGISTDCTLVVGKSTEELVMRIGGQLNGSAGYSKYIRFQSQTTGASNRYADIKLNPDESAFQFYAPKSSGPTHEAISILTTNEVVINEPGASADFRVETDSYTDAFFVDGSADNILLNVNTVSTTAIYGGNTGYANFKVNASGSGANGNTWLCSNRLRYDESTGQFQRSSATEQGSMILLDTSANIIFYTQPSLTQTGTYSLDPKAQLFADGHFNALGLGYGVQSVADDTTNFLAGKITSGASINYDFELDSSTGDWSSGYFYIKASTVNSNQAGPAAAWWLYHIMHYNGSLSGASLKDSGGDTGSFTITISDQGGTDPITVRVNIAHSNNRLTTSVECGNYYGVRSVT